MDALVQISKDMPIFFPIHPRTKKNLESFHLMEKINGEDFELLPPLPYMKFLNLWKDASLVLTDSGGLQEETTTLGIPCFTIRENTERPITITHGTNQLCELNELQNKAESILSGTVHKGSKIELWDGKTADRIVAFLRKLRQD